MTDQPPQISILDARLAEIDQRLRTIQTGLVTDAASAPSPMPRTETASLPPRVQVPEPGAHPAQSAGFTPLTAAPEPGSSKAVSELRDLTAAQEGLVGSMRDVLSALEFVLGQASGVAAGSEGPAEALATVTAGPFASTEAVRGFERRLSALPGVRAVELRGYEGGNRAIVDVHLSDATS